jgi:hypothetical protein
VFSSEVITKRIIFCDVKPYSPIEIHQGFAKICCLQLQSPRYARQATGKKEAESSAPNFGPTLTIYRLTFLSALWQIQFGILAGRLTLSASVL